MRRLLSHLAVLAFVLGLPHCVQSASLPAAWQKQQSFNMKGPGLSRITLPTDILSQARPDLNDLRLCDPDGQEVPFVIQRPKPAPKISRKAKDFQVSISPSQTTLTIETGIDQALSGVTLETPAHEFIKAVGVSASADGKTWQSLAQGRAIFRQRDGAGQLQVALPSPGRCRWLRLIVDDHRSPPVPFSGAIVHAANPAPVPGISIPAAIKEHDENPGETRLCLELGAANLDVAAVKLETPSPLFMRHVTVAVPQISDHSIQEKPLSGGTIYRVAVEDQSPSELLSLYVEQQIPSRTLLLLINNQDSQPLQITSIQVEYRPVYLVFFAQKTGTYRLLSGNPRAIAPKYDLASLDASLRDTAVHDVEFSPLADNPDYHAPEVLPGVGADGAKLDTAPWQFRKTITPARAGVQQLELDLDVLSHATPGLGDLRIMRADSQIPFILENTSITRSLAPEVSPANDPKQPSLSRWIIKLPRPGLPIVRLHCASESPLFRRDMVVWENAAGERGETYRRQLGSTSWLRTPDHKSKDLFLNLQAPPSTDTLILETDNRDNPAIQLREFHAFYRVTRMLFKAGPEETLSLYYGNPQISAPSYDLSLVAAELQAAAKLTPALGKEEQLRQVLWTSQQSGKAGFVFWGILALVVVVLLAVISLLLPKPSA